MLTTTPSTPKLQEQLHSLPVTDGYNLISLWFVWKLIQVSSGSFRGKDGLTSTAQAAIGEVDTGHGDYQWHSGLITEMMIGSMTMIIAWIIPVYLFGVSIQKYVNTVVCWHSKRRISFGAASLSPRYTTMGRVRGALGSDWVSLLPFVVRQRHDDDKENSTKLRIQIGTL